MLVFLVFLATAAGGAYLAGVRPRHLRQLARRPAPTDELPSLAEQLGAEAAASARPGTVVDVTGYPRTALLRRQWVTQTTDAYRQRLGKSDRRANRRWADTRRRQEQSVDRTTRADGEALSAERAAEAEPRWAAVSSRGFGVFLTLTLWTIDALSFHASVITLKFDDATTWVLSVALGALLLAGGIGAGAVLHRLASETEQTQAQRRTRAIVLAALLLGAGAMIVANSVTRNENERITRTASVVSEQAAKAPQINAIGRRDAAEADVTDERSSASPLPSALVPSASFLPYVQAVAFVLALLFSLAHRDDADIRRAQKKQRRTRTAAARHHRQREQSERVAGTAAETVQASQRNIVRFAEDAIGAFQGLFAEARMTAVDAGAADLIVPDPPTLEDVLELLSPDTIPRLTVPLPGDPLPPVADQSRPGNAAGADQEGTSTERTSRAAETGGDPGQEPSAEPTVPFPRERPVNPPADVPRADPFASPDDDRPDPTGRRETPYRR